MPPITFTGDLKSPAIAAVQVAISVPRRIAGIGVEQRVELKVVDVGKKSASMVMTGPAQEGKHNAPSI